MDWFSELVTAFQALGALEQTAWVGGALVPIAGVIPGLRRFSAGSRKDEKPLPQPQPVNINLPAPAEKPRTEGEIVGIFHDLEDDAKSRVLETLNKIAGQPPEADETRAEIAEAVEEARAGDLTDIRALLNSRYQKLAGEYGGAAKFLAEAARDLAAVEFPDNKSRALALYRQATELEPDHFGSWIERGRTERACERLEAAMASFDRALSIATRKDDNREIAIAESEKADAFMASGNLAGAEKRYIAANEAMTRRADAAPEDLQRQRDLSVSHDRIGDVRVTQSNLPQALQAYQAGLEIAEKLTAADPGNAGWQRDLSVSHNKIGDVRVAEGNLPQALQAYQASLEIAEKLAAADPGNAGWQRDLSVSHNKIGDVRRAQGNLPQALQAYRASLEIAEKLAAADPGNAEWQRDLLISNIKLADTGDQPAKRLARALEIAQALRDTGRLNPTDQWMIDDLKKRIARLPDI